MNATHAQTPPTLATILARLSQERDRDAWKALLHSAGPEMQRLARRLMGEAALADDALQEALLHIRDRAAQFRPTDSGDPDHDARRWILRLTANICISMLRSRRRAQKRERAHGAEHVEQAAPHEVMERSEQADLLRRELALLPAPSSTAIVLHHVSGLSFEEIAATLGVPVGTAKTKVRRGLLALRERLARVGVAMSVTMLVGALGELSAAEGGATLATYSALLHSPLKASVVASSYAGMSVAAKVAIVASLVAAGSVAIIQAVATKTNGLPLVDFENGTWPAHVEPGEIVPGPARAGNRYCAKGGEKIHPEGGLQREFLYAPERGLDFVTYEPDMRLEFDCWFTSQLDYLDVSSWNVERKASFFADFAGLKQGEWIHVSVPLGDLHLKTISDRIQPGEALGNLAVGIAARPEDQLYIDNLTITRP